MSNLRRYFKNGDIVFITIVTYGRECVLIEDADLLEDSLRSIRKSTSFETTAYVYLPDHIHLLLKSNSVDLPKLIQRFKMSFGAQYRIRHDMKSGRVWQNRYWDRIIRNQDDMNRHIDYIHYNPVKHGLVKRPYDWKYSSIHNYRDIYQDDWGVEVIDYGNGFGE